MKLGLFRILLLLLVGPVVSTTALAHPLKLSASLVEYDSSKKKLRMQCKVFIDDFELSLYRTVLKGVDLSALNAKDKTTAVQDYFERFYTIRVNGEQVPLKVTSIRPLLKQNVLVIKFSSGKVPLKKGDEFRIRNAIFFRDFGPAQTNRVVVRMPAFGVDDWHAANVFEPTLNFTLGEFNK